MGTHQWNTRGADSLFASLISHYDYVIRKIIHYFQIKIFNESIEQDDTLDCCIHISLAQTSFI